MRSITGANASDVVALDAPPSAAGEEVVGDRVVGSHGQERCDRRVVEVGLDREAGDQLLDSGPPVVGDHHRLDQGLEPGRGAPSTWVADGEAG
jgi:hypothetical protein